VPLERAVLRDVVPVVGPRLQQALLPYSRLAERVSPQTKETLKRYGVELTNPNAAPPDPSEPHWTPGQLVLYHRVAGPMVDRQVANVASTPGFERWPPEQQTSALAGAVARGKLRFGKDAMAEWSHPLLQAQLDDTPPETIARLAAAYDAAAPNRKFQVLQRDNYALKSYEAWVKANGGGPLGDPRKIQRYTSLRP
jgi:hypothetical protein